jgi:murein DD-endopeptidase MepM/ murein hydrolase activator NlpD
MVRLAIDPPPSSGRERSRRGPLAAVFGIAILVALAAGFWIGRVTALRSIKNEERMAAAEPPMTAPAVPPAPPTATGTPTAAAPASGTAIPSVPGTATATGAAAPLAPQAASPSAPPAGDGPRRLVVSLNGPLEESIAMALGKEDRSLAEELTAVVNRLLVWDLHVARDGRKGDKLEVLWTPPAPAAPGVPASGEPVVVALRYASGKRGAVLAAYRFEPKGARWARYYRADGTEVESRLVDAPVAEYEQITSLLRDGRRHKGIDFKTPVGSPVVAPFDGVIERRNWHFSANGNCLDIRDPASGRHAIFLHLDVLPKEMQPGRKVRKGEVIAASGNSGHSFAPHLHYQLEDASGKVLDPFEILKTERRSLPAAEKPAFEAARQKLDAALSM